MRNVDDIQELADSFDESHRGQNGCVTAAQNLGQLEEADVASHQIRDERVSLRQEFDDRPGRIEDRVDLLEHRRDKLIEEVAQSKPHVAELHLRRAQIRSGVTRNASSRAGDVPIEMEVGDDRGEVGVATEAGDEVEIHIGVRGELRVNDRRS